MEMVAQTKQKYRNLKWILLVTVLLVLCGAISVLLNEGQWIEMDLVRQDRELILKGHCLWIEQQLQRHHTYVVIDGKEEHLGLTWAGCREGDSVWKMSLGQAQQYDVNGQYEVAVRWSLLRGTKPPSAREDEMNVQ
jgi:hypothetical protein